MITKLTHATRLLDQLEAEARAFLAERFFEIHRTEEPPGLVWRIYVRHPIPSWSCLVGDIIHNLRSSLDHLACGLVRAGGGTVGRRTYFPIAESEAAFNERVGQDLRGATTAAIDAVRLLRPFPGGTDRLWHLHSLDVLDKHRDILVVGACAGQVTLRMTMPGFGNGPVEFPPITINPADPVLPVTDGAIVFSSHQRDLPFKEPEFPVFVAFADDPVRGHNAVNALREMCEATSRASDRPAATHLLSYST